MNKFLEKYIDPEEIVNFLKSEIHLKEVWRKILLQKVIQRAANDRAIIVTAEEIETEANRQRREKRLEKAADTITWLTNQLITPHDWETGIRNHLLAKKLAEALFAKEVENFFIQNRLEFEQVILYQMILPYEKLAQELYYQIEEDEVSFYEAAHLYDTDDKRRQQCGFEGIIYRFALSPDIASVLFNTPPKQLIGPLKTEQGYHLLIVEELIPAELTTQRYQEILDHMFQQWLNSELEHMLRE
jgi:parvulin-like peptidyl-prolyl isomerase